MDVGELLLGIGRFVLATTLLLLLTVPTAFIVIQMELKFIAQMQLRLGPNRVGPWGMFQSTIHGFKVLAKEDTTPDQADRPTFTMAPWMVFMAAAM
ncbi:MAG TPA: NADH-quinone oxidoreductase subunit H, partial [Pseudonocardiaceae bacterium]|nr:NADH-quinone oxidoreductase subunit H [Pseudonocardiaceae bacterium]